MVRKLVEVINSQYRIGVTVEVDEDEKTGEFHFVSVRSVRSDNLHNLGQVSRLEAGTLYQLIWDTYTHLRKKIDMDNKDIDQLRIQIAKPFSEESVVDRLENKLLACNPKVDVLLAEEVDEQFVLRVAPGEVADTQDPLKGVIERERAALTAQLTKKRELLEKQKSMLWVWRSENLAQSGVLLNLYCSMAKMPHKRLLFDRKLASAAL